VSRLQLFSRAVAQLGIKALAQGGKSGGHLHRAAGPDTALAGHTTCGGNLGAVQSAELCRSARWLVEHVACLPARIAVLARSGRDRGDTRFMARREISSVRYAAVHLVGAFAGRRRLDALELTCRPSALAIPPTRRGNRRSVKVQATRSQAFPGPFTAFYRRPSIHRLCPPVLGACHLSLRVSESGSLCCCRYRSKSLIRRCRLSISSHILPGHAPLPF
jgi:hypothetical protein